MNEIFNLKLQNELDNLLLLKNIFSPIVALAYLQQSQSEDDLENAFESICGALNCTTEDEVWLTVEQYTGIVSTLRALLRLKVKTVRQQNLEAELINLG